MIRNKKGFTLIEIIVVLVILAILAAAAIPTMLGFVNSGDEKICISYRGSMKRFFIAHNISDTNCTLEKIFAGDCNALSEDFKEFQCPSGGVYSPGKDGKSIKCSIHGDSKDESGQGSGEGSENYPGTDIVIHPSYWPKPEDFKNDWDIIKVPAGGIFKHTDGKYYIVTKDLEINKNQASTGPGGEVYGWYNTQEITGKIVDVKSGETNLTVTRGDICKFNGEYYVFKDGGNVGHAPDTGNGIGQWYKIPK